MADGPEALQMDADRIEAQRRLVLEARALFGARHYRRYRWLLTLSDAAYVNGLEHHESSDNRLPERALLDWAPGTRWVGLLAHEYAHSWNGKYRRPAGLVTSDYQQPMRGDLLWVYEGLTRYLGDFLLAGRSGLRSADATREYVAWIAANQDHDRPGRQWRPLADTAVAAQLLIGSRLSAEVSQHRRSTNRDADS